MAKKGGEKDLFEVVKKSRGFDRKAHNQKIAKIRGKEWKSKLKWSKLGENASLMAWERVGKNLSQRDMVRLTSVGSQVTYLRIENRTRKANKKNAETIAKTLGVKVADIFKPLDNGMFEAI